MLLRIKNIDLQILPQLHLTYSFESSENYTNQDFPMFLDYQMVLVEP